MSTKMVLLKRDSQSGTTTTTLVWFLMLMVVVLAPLIAGYGGLLRNYAGYYLSGFSGYIHNSIDILYTKLLAIYQGSC